MAVAPAPCNIPRARVRFDMTPISPAVDAAARRLLAATEQPESAGERAAGPAEVIDAVAVSQAARSTTRLAEALARWFGPYGYHALLTRALAEASVRHPVLAAVRVRDPLTPVLDGLDEALETNDPDAVLEGVTAVVAGVIALLARVIGEDMALRLVEQSMDGPAPNGTSPRGSASGGGGAP